MRIVFTLWIALLFCACSTSRLQVFTASNKQISYMGRTLQDANGNVELISSAAIAGFEFKGDSCILQLSNLAGEGDYNYAAIELDNQYKGRLKVSSKLPESFVIRVDKKQAWHVLRIYKATEAQNGVVVVNKIDAMQLKALPAENFHIEFIGNSITCGMGNDTREIPCGNGSKWYDQHNAYWSYAPQVARALHAGLMLSAISGAGIYRNWNSDGPTVPQQYENAYLNTTTKAWQFSNFTPGIVSIALGTNDLSAGDGKTARAAFDSAVFVDTYLHFIHTIYTHYPTTQIVLLTSPMVTGNNAIMLSGCLKAIQVKANASENNADKPIRVFEFSPVTATGCSGHPTIAEHTQMAEQLIPFFTSLVQAKK
jgi:lysophospholipase L1-like esterase